MASSPRQYRLGLFSITVTAILWGSIGIAASMAPPVRPLTMGAAAMGCGGLLQALSALPSLYHARALLKKYGLYVLLGGLAVAIDPLAFYTSMHMSGVAVSTVVSLGSAPLFSAIIDTVMDRVTLGPRWYLSAALGITGIALLCFAERAASLSHHAAPAPITGIILALIMGFTYAFYSWAAHRLIQRQIPSRAAMGSIFGVGGLLLMPVLFSTGGAFLLSWHYIAAAAYLAVVPMLIGFMCFGYGLRHVPASTATTITLLEPTVAALLAVFILGERLPWVGWGGIGLIMLSLICVTSPKKGNNT